MYQVESAGSAIRTRRHWLSVHPRRWASSNVLFLGLTSFFTDISSEMVATVLPLYIIFNLQLSPLQYGVVDGLYHGVSVLVRLVGGILADHWKRYKEVAVVGYALSAVCRLGLLFWGSSWSAVAAIVAVDRAGKGIRTAPRDALIARSSQPDKLATAFGVHRAFDTAGAMIGPLMAFMLLSFIPGGFDAIFVVSFCFALIGLAVLVLFVENRCAASPTKSCRTHNHHDRPALRCPSCRSTPSVPPGASLRAALGLLRMRRFTLLLAAGGLLGVTTLSDGFLFLNIQRQMDLAVGFFPLLYVATSFVYMLLAIPTGWLADRLDRGYVLMAGYAFLLIVYLLLLVPDLPSWALLASVPLLGAYYAATDGVLMALSSAILPPSLYASGLALLASVIGVARLVASVLFGLLWTWIGADGALMAFAAGLPVATLAAGFALLRMPKAVRNA